MLSFSSSSLSSSLLLAATVVLPSFWGMVDGQQQQQQQQQEQLVPDYGFPRCYTSFDDYDNAFTESSLPNGGEERPLSGQKRFPYLSSGGTTVGQCQSLYPMPEPLVALGPHWSPIGLTIYNHPKPPPSNNYCANCLPKNFDGTLIVASHGSWNRDPFIGYNVKSYDISDNRSANNNGAITEPPYYNVTDQRTLLPSLRNAATGIRIRPVDVRTSPVGDGALLMTADRDDLDIRGNRGGGLYRVRGGGSGSGEGEGGSSSSPVEPIDLAAVNTDDENPANVTLERLAGIECARQMTVSATNPRLMYVSTMGIFCPANAGGRIWVVELEPDDSVVSSGPSILAEGFHEPQGIDWSNGSLYIATDGSSSSATTMGNCILEIENVDDLATAVLNGSAEPIRPSDGTTTTTKTTKTTAKLSTVVCDFTMIQRQHSWRSLRVHPLGNYAIVTVGAECNWSPSCHDGSRGAKDMQTTLVRIELTPKSKRGDVSVAAKGIRNSIGLYFDVNGNDKNNLIFTVFGSDQAAGIPAATSANNVPDCTVEVLPLLTLPSEPGTSSAAPFDVLPLTLPSEPSTSSAAPSAVFGFW